MEQEQQLPADLEPRRILELPLTPIQELEDSFALQADDVGVNLEEKNQINILRHLLMVERERNGTRRDNNNAMQQYLSQLQTEYLRLQRDLLEALELGHKIKAQKEAQLETLSGTLEERDRTIEQLKSNLNQLDESKLREEFKELTLKQEKLVQLEKDQLKAQIVAVEQQLTQERIINSQTLQQFKAKYDNQLQLHECETTTLREELSQIDQDLKDLLNEPKNLIIKSLKEEKSHLECQMEELNLVLTENQTKYESMRRRLENLLAEQEQLEQKNLENYDKLQEQYVEQRKQLNELLMKLEDKEEINQITQFNLTRSEKRVRNLLTALKGKENTYKDLIGELEAKHNEELSKKENELQVLGKSLLENKKELDSKQNEIVRLQLEHENQLESIKNDRDVRVIKLLQEKEKVDRALQVVEIKLAKEIEEKEIKCKQVEQLQKETNQFREESKRLSLEVTKCEAKLHAKQQELNQTLKRYQVEAESSISKEQYNLEIEDSERRIRRLEETIDELRKDNDKLFIKVKLHETNMGKINEAINKERAKMLNDYEQKLKQIRAEQNVCDENRLRYKRYGCKLKKYCEHLRKAHEHFCNPSVCGQTFNNNQKFEPQAKLDRQYL